MEELAGRGSRRGSPYFDREHAQQLGGVKQMSCNHPKCRGKALELKDLNHFKNHVQKVHGVKLRA
ncbi:hypothetical protein QBC36DRAFT_200542 [Triangularia setosa]|uniref:Uncharacterized protein n=1 Tax=Triangularia setosa TaxID=2587417 RepID=A0AAN7A0K4_9PEZI|nr:hypothetical protein QBC36DRAFT_200542 [Podospora setosa]